jgi:DHA1 family bicyclomycin/chloramphenicol resistance-like MFS transporter
MTVALGGVLTLITGALVTAENGPYVVLTMMSASSFAGLLAILFVRRLDRLEPLTGAD